MCPLPCSFRLGGWSSWGTVPARKRSSSAVLLRPQSLAWEALGIDASARRRGGSGLVVAPLQVQMWVSGPALPSCRPTPGSVVGRDAPFLLAANECLSLRNIEQAQWHSSNRESAEMEALFDEATALDNDILACLVQIRENMHKVRAGAPLHSGLPFAECAAQGGEARLDLLPEAGEPTSCGCVLGCNCRRSEMLCWKRAAQQVLQLRARRPLRAGFPQRTPHCLLRSARWQIPSQSAEGRRQGLLSACAEVATATGRRAMRRPRAAQRTPPGRRARRRRRHSPRWGGAQGRRVRPKPPLRRRPRPRPPWTPRADARPWGAPPEGWPGGRRRAPSLCVDVPPCARTSCAVWGRCPQL